MTEDRLEFRNVTKRFASRKGIEPVTAVQDLTFGIADGEIVSIIGPSGCGKSTLLNMGSGLDPATLLVGDLVGPELVTAGVAEGVFEVLQRMHASGVRRIPVVDEDGALVGIATADDVLQYLAAELQHLSRLVGTEQAREQQTRR